MAKYIISLLIPFLFFIDCRTTKTDCSKSWVYFNNFEKVNAIIEKPLEYFTDSFTQLSNINFYQRYDNPDSLDPVKIAERRLDTIGTFHEKTVLRLYLRFRMKYGYYVGSILLINMAGNDYRLLNLALREQYYPVNVGITYVDSTQVLYNQSNVGGQFLIHYEDDWVWDEECDCPCLLEPSESPAKTLAPLIKQEFYLSSGGFDIESLTRKSQVGFPGDHERFPSGGKARIRYRIDGCKLIVIEKYYDPKDIATH